jgi:cytochrome c-type protein NapB
MKKLLPVLVTSLVIVACATPSMKAMATPDVQSLRAGVAVTSVNTPVSAKAVLEPEDGFNTSWDSQPPSVPHKIDKDIVSLTENTCMNCHSKANYKKEGAVKIGKSHYYDRDGKRLKTLSSRRYFCVQCHTPQLDAKELVENTFKGEDE